MPKADRVELHLPYCKRVLAEAEAKLFPRFDDTGRPLLRDVEIQRGWIESVPEKASQLVDYLEIYTSAKNDEPLLYVDDPVASGEIFEGRYRNAFTQRIKQSDGRGGFEHVIIQTLRKGFIENVLLEAGTIDWSEARVQKGRSLPPGDYDATSEHYLMVFWPGVSPDAVKKVVDQINGRPDDNIDNVRIREEAYGDNWHRVFTTYQMEEDGSATVFMFLALPEYTLYGLQGHLTDRQTDVTYVWGVPKGLAQDIITAFQATGRSARASYNTQQGLVDLTLYARDTTGLEIEDDVSRLNCNATETTDYYWGISQNDAENTYNIPAQSDGWTYSKNIRSNGDGSFDVTITGRQVSYRTYAFANTRVSGLSSEQEDKRLGLTNDANIPDISSPAQGDIYEMRRRINDDCSKDIITVIRRSVADDFVFDSRQAGLTTSIARRWRNSRSVIDATTAVQGSIYVARNRLNDDLSYDSERISSVSVADSVYIQWESSHGGMSLDLFRNQRTLPAEIAALDDTTRNNVSASLNEDQTYDVTIRRSPPGPDSSVDFEDGTYLYYHYVSNGREDDIYIYKKYFTSENSSGEFLRRDEAYATMHEEVGHDSADYTVIGSDSGNRTQRRRLAGERFWVMRVERLDA
jgi:hypothetical protein